MEPPVSFRFASSLAGITRVLLRTSTSFGLRNSVICEKTRS
jgi:hypothetical protein